MTTLLGRNWTANEAQKLITCKFCGAQVVYVRAPLAGPMQRRLMCADCADWHESAAIAARIMWYRLVHRRVLRLHIERQLTANLQRLLTVPALPAGDVIAMPVPEPVSKYDWENDPDGIFVLDLSAYQRPVPVLTDIEKAMLRKQTVERAAA